MPRKTPYFVYVDKETMEKPSAVFDAVYAHFIKKGLDIAKRKQFMALFLKAHARRKGMELINEWVQIRDLATYPFRKEQDSDMAKAGVKGAEAGKKLREEVDDGRDTVIIEEAKLTKKEKAREKENKSKEK